MTGMFRAIAFIGILQVLTIIVQVVRAKAISVVLGPSGLGIIGLIDQLIVLIAMVCALSLPTVVVRVMSRVHGKPEFARQYASFLNAILAVSIIGSLAVGLVLVFQSSALGEIPAQYATEFTIALIGVPLTALGFFLPNVLAASMRPISAAVLSFSIAAVTALAAGAGLLTASILDIYIWQATATGALIVGTLVYFSVKLHLPFRDPSAGLVREIRERPDIVPTSIAIYASLVGSSFSLLAVRYVTVHSLGAEAGGLLQAILSMVLAVNAVLVSMAARYLGPILNRPGTPTSEKFETFDLFRRRQLMILIAGSIPMILFAKPALIILFSSKFVAAAEWLPAFLVWQLLVIQTNVQLQLLFALDELWIVTIKSIVGVVVSTILCALLIPLYGITGGAVAMLAGSGLMLAIGAVRLRRHGYMMAPSSLVLGGYAVAALMIAPYLALGGAWDSIPLKIVACLALIGGLWPFLSSEEKAAIRHPTRRAVVPNSIGS